MKKFQQGSLVLKKSTHEFIRIYQNSEESGYVSCHNHNSNNIEKLSIHDIEPISVDSEESKWIGVNELNIPMNKYNTTISLDSTNVDYYKDYLEKNSEFLEEDCKKCKYIHEIQYLLKGYTMLYFEIMDKKRSSTQKDELYYAKN